jgi:two-component system response regulator NreC
MAVRILLADDHQVVREGFRALLEREGFEVVAEASDGYQATQLARTIRFDVAVLDLSMPRMNGVDTTIEIRTVAANSKIVLLTVHNEEHLIAAALRAGVRGYVTKTQAGDDLSRAISAVFNGGTYLSPHVSGLLLSAYLAGTSAGEDPLTQRERQVLQLVAEGKTTKEIADILGLTPKTAESYRARLMSKLDIHDTAGLVRYAIRKGIVQLAAAGVVDVMWDLPNLAMFAMGIV